MTTTRPAKPREFMAVLALLVVVSTLYSLTANPGRDIVFGDKEIAGSHVGPSDADNAWQPSRRQLRAIGTNSEPPSAVSVCGRVADDFGSTQDLALQEKYATCPRNDPRTTPIVVLEGHLTFGRDANQLRAFLRAIQYARDKEFDLAIMYHSWAMDVLHQYFMASSDGAWDLEVERALCIKVILRPKEELAGRDIILKNSVQMFHYRSISSEVDFVSNQLYVLRTLFQHHNTGELGQDQYGNQVRDMCSGIDSLFSKESRSSVIYSAVHLRYLEGTPGRKILASTAESMGCDPRAALEMEPDYVKSILKPLDMLNHPIVVITDGQNRKALKRLMADPDIGPNLLIVSGEASWIGGDITLATMANVFIGNPASTFSHFIAKSRISLGIRHNYLYRAKNEDGEWTTTCGVVCLFMGEYMGGKDVNLYEKHFMMTDKRPMADTPPNVEQWQRNKEEIDADRELKSLAYGPGPRKYWGV